MHYKCWRIVVMNSNYSFPKNFLWGGATSANQIEGGYNKGNKGTSIMDLMIYDPEIPRSNALDTLEINSSEFTKRLSDDSNNYPKRRGVDFYTNFKQDIKLFSEMGLKMLRISIDWSRIYPTGFESEPNEEGLNFYDNVIDTLIEYGIMPLIIMQHYDIPVSIVDELNGWENKKTIELFLKYSETLIDRYHEKVKYWVCFNEISMIVSSPFTGGGILKDRSKLSLMQLKYQAIHYQFIANARTIKYAKRYSDLNFGAMNAHLEYYPKTSNPEDILKSQQDSQKNTFFFEVMIKGKYPYYMERFFKEENIQLSMTKEEKQILFENKSDFIAFSYYQSYISNSEASGKMTSGNIIGSEVNPYLKTNEWGWPIDPVGLRVSLNKLYDKFQVPLFILENGFGAEDILTNNNEVNDLYRIDYIKQHIIQIGQAIKDGVDVLGYLVWSPIDLVSATGHDMNKRYGMIYVDLDNYGNGTKQRYKKQSFYWYKELIENNGNNISE